MATHQIDSLIKFTNSQGIGATGTLVQISRNSIVIEVYNPYSIVQLSEVLSELRIRREERIIYQGRAVVSTLVNTGLYLVVSATLVDPWQDLSGVEQDSTGIQEEALRFLSDWESSYELLPDYQLTVLKMRSILTELSRWLEQVDLFADDDGVSHSPDLTRELFEELQAPLLPKLKDLLQRFESESAKIPKELVNNHRHFAQRDLHPLLLRSPFFWRTFNKPLGYAGDYEMVNMMLRNSHEGPTTYSKLINSLFLDASPPVIAHRNRIDILQKKLSGVLKKVRKEKGHLKILNIGCGPAIEIQRFIKAEELSPEDHITLLDFSEETLMYTRQKMNETIQKTPSNPTIEYIHKSVHQLLKEAVKPSNTDMESYDMVYCAGLFDYLSDKVCSRLMRLFWANTKPGGIVLSTNVHSGNPFIFTMEFLMEWAPHLSQRRRHADSYSRSWRARSLHG